MIKNFRGNKNDVFVKFMRHIIVILLVPLLILLIIYAELTKGIYEQVCERNLNILENSARDMEEVFQNLEKMIIYYSGNVSITNYVVDSHNKEKRIQYIRQAQKELEAMNIADQNVINIQLYFSQNDSLIDFTTCAMYPERYYGGTFAISGMNYEKWREICLETNEKKVYLTAPVIYRGITQEALIYNCNFGIQGASGSKDRMIFYLSKEVLLNLFGALDYMDGGFVYVLDSQKNCLLSSDATLNYEAIPDSSSMEEKKGYCKLTIHGEKKLVTYLYGESNGMLYVAAVPYDKVMSVLKTLQISMVFLIVLAALTGIFLSLIVARRLSKPIANVGSVLGKEEERIPYEEFEQEIVHLVESNTELRNEMEQNMSGIRTAAFYNLLLGNEDSREKIREQMELIGIRQDAKYYVVLIFVWNDMNLDGTLEEISALKVFLESIIRQQKKEQIQGIFQLDLERTLVLLASDSESVSSVRTESELLVREILKEAKQNIFYSISVGGDMLPDFMDLSKGFSHAQRALRVQKNIFGKHEIQWYERVRQYEQSEAEELVLTEGQEGRSSWQIVEQIKGFIEENYNNPQLSLNMVAEAFYITEVYLSKLFKSETGQNFSKYIEALRMERAKEMLNQKMFVNDVAEKVGYNSPQVFRRAWKRYYGTTPSETIQK